MSSRRRSRDKKGIPTKLRMDDTKPQQSHNTDRSSSRKREIDDVMKKARAQKSPTSGAFWDKKLLEVEAKDPNRWRHTGYKSMYIDGKSPTPSPDRRPRSRSRSRFRYRSRSRSRSRSVSRSPMLSRGRRSPVGRRASPKSPPSRRAASPRSPPPQRSRGARGRSSSGRRSPSHSSRRALPSRPRSPPSPSPRTPRGSARRSLSNSSISSCSDESCSVCSPKGGHRNVRSRSRSFSPNRVSRSKPPPPQQSQKSRTAVRTRPPSPPAPPKRVGRPCTPPSHPVRSSKVPAPPSRPNPSDRPTDPRRQPPPPRPRGSTGEVIDVRGVRPPTRPPAAPSTKKSSAGEKPQPMLLKRIKKERTGPKRPGSPAESSGSEESAPTPPPAPIVATTSLTLSERFGKIAQWSADRERRDLENMRITKTGASMKVMVEEDYLYGSPPRSLSPVPTGHFPEKLLSSGQSRTAAWDDVRVRYQYYKDLGYLRDLTLEDYVKWEEWWYKYQDWLANERHYEHWLSTHGGGGGRRRKKRIPASQRLN